jgi:iron complex transport system ATP-binding protein
LFKALCGEVIPASGEVSMAGQPLRAWSSAEQAKMRAILPQESALSFPFTALEVVLMGRTPHNNDSYESKRDYAIAQMALETVEAAHLNSRLYPTLSGGE